MLKHWKKISSKIVFKNPWWTYKLDEYAIPGGVKGEYHSVYTEGASMIVPVMDDRRIILVNQYRYLCEKESIELPCGGVKPGKTHEEMAHLELGEETGFRSDNLKYAAEFNPYNGVTNEICKVFIAKDLVKTNPKPDETEEFEFLFKTPDEIDSLIRNNIIWDGMTIAGWGLIRHLM
jgi:ADP-ribose pyrophosphatase